MHLAHSVLVALSVHYAEHKTAPKTRHKSTRSARTSPGTSYAEWVCICACRPDRLFRQSTLGQSDVARFTLSIASLLARAGRRRPGEPATLLRPDFSGERTRGGNSCSECDSVSRALAEKISDK